MSELKSKTKGTSHMKIWHWVWLALVILGIYYVYGHWVAKKF